MLITRVNNTTLCLNELMCKNYMCTNDMCANDMCKPKPKRILKLFPVVGEVYYVYIKYMSRNTLCIILVLESVEREHLLEYSQ